MAQDTRKTLSPETFAAKLQKDLDRLRNQQTNFRVTGQSGSSTEAIRIQSVGSGVVSEASPRSVNYQQDSSDNFKTQLSACLNRQGSVDKSHKSQSKNQSVYASKSEVCSRSDSEGSNQGFDLRSSSPDRVVIHQPVSAQRTSTKPKLKLRSIFKATPRLKTAKATCLPVIQEQPGELTGDSESSVFRSGETSFELSRISQIRRRKDADCTEGNDNGGCCDSPVNQTEGREAVVDRVSNDQISDLVHSAEKQTHQVEHEERNDQEGCVGKHRDSDETNANQTVDQFEEMLSAQNVAVACAPSPKDQDIIYSAWALWHSSNVRAKKEVNSIETEQSLFEPLATSTPKRRRKSVQTLYHLPSPVRPPIGGFDEEGLDGDSYLGVFIDRFQYSCEGDEQEAATPYRPKEHVEEISHSRFVKLILKCIC